MLADLLFYEVTKKKTELAFSRAVSSKDIFSSFGPAPYLNSRNGAGSCLIKKPAPFLSEDIFSSFGPASYLNSIIMELGFT